MFLDLPIELQHYIYDKLHITDRFNLNRALVRHKITKTSKTSKEKDRKLALCFKAFQNKKKYNPISSSYILDFIKSNSDDPTIQSINDEENIKTYISPIVKIGNMIKENNIILEELDNVNGDDLHIKIQITTYVRFHANPTTFDIIRNKFPNIYINDKVIKDLFIGCIYYTNEKLLNYIKDIEEYRVGVDYLADPDICSIFTTELVKLEMFLKYIPLSQEAIDLIKDNAVTQLNFSIFELLNKYNYK